MSIKISTQFKVKVLASQWNVYSNDTDILTGVDVLDVRGVQVGVRFKPHSYSGTNYVVVRLRHSDEAGSGYVDVPAADIEGGTGDDGVLIEQRSTITPDDAEAHTHSFGYTGSKRYLAVRFDEVGNVTSASVGATVVVLEPRELGSS